MVVAEKKKNGRQKLQKDYFAVKTCKRTGCKKKITGYKKFTCSDCQ